MVADGTYTAVLDRFEGDRAVLLLESDESVVGERVVAPDVVPEAGRHQDAVLVVELRDGAVRNVAYDPDATAARRAAARARFDRLAGRRDEGGDDADPGVGGAPEDRDGPNDGTGTDEREGTDGG